MPLSLFSKYSYQKCDLLLQVLLGSWLRKASAQVQVIYDEKIDRLKSLKWALSAADMGEKLKLLFDDCVARFDAADQDGDAVRSAIESFKNFTELRNLKFSESNTKKMLTSEAEVREMIRNAVEQMKREVDQEVRSDCTAAAGQCFHLHIYTAH